MNILLTLNGVEVVTDVPAHMLLVDVLRDRHDLTGVHVGCEVGACGACTILVDGVPARSCLMFAAACDGLEVRTIEGLRDDPVTAALRESFHLDHGLQCGYCTPAMLITGRDLIMRGCAGSEAEVRDGLAGNICRCTGYTNIVTAIRNAERALHSQAPESVRAASHSRSEGKGVGASLLRKEDARHLLGEGRFTADVKRPGTREIAFLRSPHAHARIKAIHVPPELAVSVFTARDLPDMKAIRAVPDASDFKPSDFPPLATDKVRFVGQLIAVCVAPTRSEAEDMAAAIGVEFDELPPVVDAIAAAKSPGVLLHEQWGDNLFVQRAMQAGDIEQARRNAEIVVEREFRMHRQAGVPLECRAVLAYRESGLDELVFYTSTQIPHSIRRGLSEMLGVSEQRIRVVAPDVGGGFGIKARLSAEEVVVAALALRLSYPVRWIEDRYEHLIAAIQARDHFYKVTAYADRSGRILGLDGEVIVDAGAYALWPNGQFLDTGMAARSLPGPYDIRHWRMNAYTVATNKAPHGPYRGVGRPGACFVMERLIDEVARAASRDPLEVRIANMVRAEQMPYSNITGMLFDGGDYPACARRCAELLDVDAIRKRQKAGENDGRLIGIGFSSYVEQTGIGCGEYLKNGSPFIPGYESCTARIFNDGSLTLLVGIQSHGQGLETTLSQVAHEILGIDPSHISVRHGDTGVSPFGHGTLASRSMVMAGGAVARASRALRDKILRIGAHVLQVEPDSVRYENAAVIGSGGSVGLREIARMAHLRMETLPDGVDPLLDVTVTYEPGTDRGVFSYATHGAVVSVDPATGHIRLLDFATVEDCGTVVNPMIVDGQIRGGVVQGIGTALYEELIYDEQGQPGAVTLGDYLVPGAAEMPAIKIDHLHIPTPHTEFGIKGMGEGGAIGPPAAIANAVRDALAPLGVEINETPMTPRRVLAAILSRR